jgi:hypothetical protein
MGKGRTPAQLLALALLLAVTATADARTTTTPLAPLPGAYQSLTAYGGWVIFSQATPDGQAWQLMAWHNGSIAALPVPPSPIPFAADAGPDLHGHPAVVYPRCTTQPESPGEWELADGCRIYELSLLGGPEHRVSALSAPDTSDFSPSLWRGAIAFGRLHGAGGVAQLLLWQPGHGLRALPRGSIPPCPRGNPCDSNQPLAFPLQLDLGPSTLAVLWSLQGPTVFGTGGSTELLADSLTSGRRTLIATATFGDVCAGGFSGGFSPSLGDGSVRFYFDGGDPCSFAETSAFASFDLATGVLSNTPNLHGTLIGALTADGPTTYWLAVTPVVNPQEGGSQPMNPGDCVPPHSCELMSSTGLPFHRSTFSPPSPPLAS